ncbi:MAG: hypothetical protein ACRDNT_07230 [Streptosporangiaceae bacterium]
MTRHLFRAGPGVQGRGEGQVCGLSADADLTHVLFNNCYRDWAHVNAQQLTARLKARPAAPAPGA